MAIIGNPWAQDAGAFGTQVGNALSAGLLRLPQERYAIALQQAQLARALEQMRANQEYQQGRLRNQLIGIEQRGQAAQDLNAVRQGQLDLKNRLAELPKILNIGGNAVMQPGIQGQQRLPMGHPQAQSVVPQQTNVTPQQLPGGVIPITLPARPMTPYQSNELDIARQNLALRKLGLNADLMNVTNSPAIQGLTNQLNQIGQPAHTVKMATPEIIQQALRQAGGNTQSARQWLQDQGYTIPQ